MSEVRRDAFLGGQLTIAQPVRGYRAGADPVFLAAAVPAHAGQRVLELGCGVGTALFCLASRVDGLELTGVERQPALAELAQQNAQDNGIDARIEVADLADLPTDILAQSYDQVMFNPPFFDRSSGSASPDESREGGRGAAETLRFWCETAVRRLAPGGCLTLINRMEQLPEVLAALDHRMGEIRVLPLQSRRLKPAKLFILRAKKGSKTGFALAPPLVLHRGDRHEADQDSYSEVASGILRKGLPLPFEN